jgi:class 3 adenylate cyclase/tetratricopeptide (TPR) repeat protein/ABC-type lipoprotein export system ATPase subunit
LEALPFMGMSMSEITSWLQSLGLEKYNEILSSNDIDLAVVPDLTEQDLEKLGFSLGHRRKFIGAAAKLKREPVGPDVPARPAISGGQPQALIERRQMTVVFADLVGSTALGGDLDPEDLIDLLRSYREACVEVIGKYDGFIAQYLGDGILVYFGFPVAQEHAAERAIRASLEIVENVGRLRQPDGRSLQVRVGIATGLVVAGSATGVGPAGEETVVGDTPNLAARLQSLADPSCVLVSPSTHRLASDFFEFSFFGEEAIKGFREPISVWKVLCESATESRFAAAHAAAAGPIVGRERELAFLYDSWQRATRGNGHFALLVGEAGMGKSRLLEALAERIKGESHRLLRGQCSPYHRNSVLFPLKKLLRHRLDLSQDLSIQGNLDRIEQILDRSGRQTRSSTLLLAELLDVPTEETLSPLEMTPSQRKEETLAILEDLLMAAHDGPVLLLLEDAHWSDQTTQTLIGRLLKRIGREKALVLVTYRPELKTDWFEHPEATLISCKPIGYEHCAALIRQVASRAQIDETVISEIVTRSDGVPLFAEELTKAVLDLRTLNLGAVPLTLQDSLMARLDRLGGAKDIAQIASVIGRQFSHVVLEAIAGASNNDLQVALGRLRASGLVFEAGKDDQSTNYSFNHSLVQEAAYESLSRSRRQALHKEIASYLESGSTTTKESEPTVIAHHYGRAGEADKSFHFWLRAASRCSQRLAFADTIANLNSALAEAERVADPKLRARLKADAQLKLGTTIAIYKGPQTNESESALEMACTLAKEANARPQLFQATWGLYINAARNQRLDKAKIRGEELLTISEAIGDEDLKFEALHHRWGYAYFTGQTAGMLDLTAEALDLYDRNRHHKLSHVFASHDPGACAHCVKAVALALAGRARSVRPALDAGLVLVHSLQHPLTLAFFHSVACTTMHIAGDLDGCREFADQLTQISARYDFPAMGVVGSFMQGAALALQADIASALKQMEPSFEGAFGYGFFGMHPGIIMAETLAAANRNQEALTLVTRLLEGSRTPEIGVFVSELWRLRGELLLRQSAGNSPEAERYFGTAVRIAEEQGAVVFLSRAGIALAQLLAESGRRDEARSVLHRASANGLDEWDGPEIAIVAQLRSNLN